MDILFSGVTVVTMDEGFTVLKDAYVGVTGQKISYVGAEPPPDKPGRVISGAHKVLMPGLCNAHTHIPMTLLRGYADDYALQPWLFDHICPAEEKMTDDMVYWGAKLATMEMLAGGTVSFSEMYDHMLAVGRAADESGMKANLSRALLHPEGGTYNFWTDERAMAARALVDRYRDSDGRIRVDMAVHAEYTSHPEVWELAARYMIDNELGMHVHLSETRAEHEACKEKYGRTPARMFQMARVFETRAYAAHCVWLENDDFEILREMGVSIVHCPVSNAKLASGAANVPQMLERGINVALGTDGVASNNSHDMFGEMKTAALVGKLSRRDPEVLRVEDILRMATQGGYAAQGREEEGGRVKPGMDADLILLDFDKPHLTPCHNVMSHLVYAARSSDVALTMVRGKVLYEDGQWLTIDAGKVLSEVRKAVKIYHS